MDTSGNELAPWVHRCGFLGFRLGSSLACWGSGWVSGWVQVSLVGVQVGFRSRFLEFRLGSGFAFRVQVGFRFGFLGSGWVQVWLFRLGVQVGFRFGFWGSGWVQVGFMLGSVIVYAKIQRFHTKDIENQHYGV